MLEKNRSHHLTFDTTYVQVPVPPGALLTTIFTFIVMNGLRGPVPANKDRLIKEVLFMG